MEINAKTRRRDVQEGNSHFQTAWRYPENDRCHASRHSSASALCHAGCRVAGTAFARSPPTDRHALPWESRLVSIALKVPSSVICLISALAFHELTIQVPHEVYLAMARGSRTPQLGCPPIRVFWFSSSVFTEGVEQHDMDGVWVRIYSPEKTLADCFKYRNRIGLDTALEALKLYRQRKTIKAEELIRFARCVVSRG